MDQVWAVLPAVYEEMEISAGVVNEEQRIFGNPNLVVNRTLAGERVSSYLDCGVNPIGAPVANSASVQINLRSQLSPSAGGTEIQTQLQALAQPRASSGGEVRCMSTGKLEARLAELVEQRLTS